MACDVSPLAWPDLLARAAAIVRSYETLVTLRQLFYRLVAGVAAEHPERLQVALEALRQGTPRAPSLG